MSMLTCSSCYKVFQSSSITRKYCEDCLTNDGNNFENCKFCEIQTEANEKICSKCQKNREKYGDPQLCVFCGVQGAFIGRKCRRCSADYKQHGEPKKCTKCNARAAFGGGEMNKYQMCRKCKTQHKLSKKRNYATMNNNTAWNERNVNNYSNNGNLPRSDSCPDIMTKDRDYRLLLSQTPTKVTPANNSSPDDQLNGLLKKAKRSTPSYSDQEQNSKNINDKQESPRSKYKSFDNRVNSLHRQLMKNFPNDIFIDKKSTNSSSRDNKTTTEESVIKELAKKTTLTTISLPRLPDINTRQSPSLSEMAKMGNSPLSLPAVNDSNIVELTNLREQIQSLKKQLGKKDALLLEKDKQISCIKVEHMQELREGRTKMKEKDNEYHQVVERLQLKNSEFARKISQLSKGKM